MSEKRFDEIDRRFDQLETEVTTLRTDATTLKEDVTTLKTDVGVLRVDVAELKAETKDLRRHIGVLHEDVIDRIRGIREDDSLRQEMRAGFAMILKRLAGGSREAHHDA